MKNAMIITRRSGTENRDALSRQPAVAARIAVESAAPTRLRLRIRFSEHGVRETFAARASGFGFAIPGFGARRWFQ